MRKIKFRGKRVDNGEWVYGDLIQYESGEFSIFSKKLSKYGYEATEMYKRDRIIPETVGQFTGLHDKNGKEIYEGDILENPDYEEAFVVEYHEGMAEYVGWGDDKIAGCYLITGDEIEVIGNIYER